MAEECVFCGIGAGKIPSKKVYEDSNSVAFLDINPRNPGHTLVIPKKHATTLSDMSPKDAGTLFSSVQKVAVAVKEATKADGISIVQNNGKAAGQVVPHVHFHVIPRFETEGPVALEAVLPSKKLDDAAMNKIADSIKNSFGQAEEEPEEEPEKEETEEGEEEEEISFDF